MVVTVRFRSLLWFATGGLVALLVGWVVMSALSVEAALGDADTTTVPITACRLADTRAAAQVGPRGLPLGAGETYTVDVQDASTQCAGEVPTAATGLVLNVTAARTSAPTFLTVWDVGPWPGTSSMNPVPGPPVPNAVTTKLSASNTFLVYNDAGSTDVIIDVVAYLTPDSLVELDARLTALETTGVDQQVVGRIEALEAQMAGLAEQNTAQQSEIDALESQHTAQQSEIDGLTATVSTLGAQLGDLESLTASMSVETVDGQPTVRFSGVNVQVVDGTGDTQCEWTSAEVCNGRGNLIIGYNESNDDARNGTHNLVVGMWHSYTDFAGLVAGFDNNVLERSVSVTGGARNTASGVESSVTGGDSNVASGGQASVSGGFGNAASVAVSAVTGGELNVANGYAATVSGGVSNTATGDQSSVTGGGGNEAIGNESSVTGGGLNDATALRSAVSGGSSNEASGQYASVTGGQLNAASGTVASVSGGTSNTASGNSSAVSGGSSNLASGQAASVTGEPQPFAVTNRDDSEDVGSGDAVVVSVTVTAPVAGQVTVNSTTTATEFTLGAQVWCSITPGTTHDLDYEQTWQVGSGTVSQLAGTRTFDIATGATITYNLVCAENGAGSSLLRDSVLTAIFTPAP